MDEKIEEMAKIMCGACIENECMTCSFTREEIPCDFSKNFAEALSKKGYRKESDTVKEILGKVLKFTLDDEVGMRYLIKNLAKEYGVKLGE